MRPQLRVSLPAQIPVEKFERVVMTAVNLNPALATADRRSLFNACTKCATDGLLPDGREAALVTFGNQVTYLPMVFGIIKKLRQSGEIAAVSARIVYENELKGGLFKFAIEDGQEKLSHAPMLMGDRGKPALAYATARFKDGTVQNEVMTVSDIEKVRSASRAKNSGPWTQWWDEMARKTVVRRLSKYLPLSAEDLRLFDEHEETEFDAMKAAAKNAEPQSIAHAAASLSAPIEAGETDMVDGTTGEVLEGDAGESQADAPEIVIQHIPIPIIDGNNHYRGWPDLVLPAIAALPSVAAVDAWISTHQAELDGMQKTLKAGWQKLTDALAARRVELDGAS